MTTKTLIIGEKNEIGLGVPLVYTCHLNAFDRLLESGAIYSRAEMQKRKISFSPDTGAPFELEKVLGTEDEICLFLSDTFDYFQFRYGGPVGPRLIFDEQVLEQKGVYALPIDQYAYMPGHSAGKHGSFEKDKHFGLEQVRGLLTKSTDRGFHPEVHVPTQLSLDFLRGLLLHESFVEEYSQRRELQHVKIIPVFSHGGEKAFISPENYKEAYERFCLD